jgi:hypothetical protein
VEVENLGEAMPTKHSTHSTYHLLTHLARNAFFGILFIAIALFVGMLGYHYCEEMSWIDAFVNAAMILSGMGPMGPLHSASGKLFAGTYALFSGLAFIAIIALIFYPLIHRFFRKIHVDEKDST